MVSCQNFPMDVLGNAILLPNRRFLLATNYDALEIPVSRSLEVYRYGDPHEDVVLLAEFAWPMGLLEPLPFTALTKSHLHVQPPISHSIGAQSTISTHEWPQKPWAASPPFLPSPNDQAIMVVMCTKRLDFLYRSSGEISQEQRVFIPVNGLLRMIDSGDALLHKPGPAGNNYHRWEDWGHIAYMLIHRDLSSPSQTFSLFGNRYVAIRDPTVDHTCPFPLQLVVYDFGKKSHLVNGIRGSSLKDLDIPSHEADADLIHILCARHTDLSTHHDYPAHPLVEPYQKFVRDLPNYMSPQRLYYCSVMKCDGEHVIIHIMVSRP